jgi:hypothetical protein
MSSSERLVFYTMDNELEKVCSFFGERETEAITRFNTLVGQLDKLAETRAPVVSC